MPPITTPVIGRILFQDSNGQPRFSAHYNVPPQLRPIELFTEHGVFAAYRQTETASWIYRYSRPRGSRDVDPYLSDYRYPDDPTWDGPKPEKPVATWKDVQSRFEALLNGASSTNGLISANKIMELFRLTKAAWNKETYEPLTDKLPSVATAELITTKRGERVRKEKA